VEAVAFEPIAARAESVAAQVIDAAVKIHKTLGPGLLESVYEICLCYELSKRGLKCRRQVDIPVRYEDVFLETGFRVDVIVDKCVIVELKSAAAIIPIHEAQLLTHLRLTKIRLGLILNFNVPLMKEGIKRMVI
jgi:GxxExxY protein